MDLYNRQMMDTRGTAFVTGGALDFISASNQENREEQVHCDVPRVKDPVPTPDAEMLDAPISTLDSRNAEAEAEADPSSGVTSEKSVEQVSCEEVHIHISPSAELEGPNLDNDQDNIGEPEPISSGVKMEVISSEKQQEVESKEAADVNGFASVEIASLAAAATPSAVVDNLEGISNNTNGDFETEEGGVALGDATNGPLCIPDGSPKGCEALMSGSKESESIILSRIHHSPESTH